jgi:dTDP-4-dehydrorhamnose 3,5-epimerase-like enzyme
LVSVDDARLIELPKIADPRGNLTFIEGTRHVPFKIRRVFYLYDVPGGETRAGHANRTLQELIIAASGSFDVVLNDGRTAKTWSLRRSYYGLYLPGMLWRELQNFSSGSVGLVLCSEYYDEGDYHRDYDDYVRHVTGGQ